MEDLDEYNREVTTDMGKAIASAERSKAWTPIAFAAVLFAVWWMAEPPGWALALAVLFAVAASQILSELVNIRVMLLSRNLHDMKHDQAWRVGG